jgi:WD40 repeat protein
VLKRAADSGLLLVIRVVWRDGTHPHPEHARLLAEPTSSPASGGPPDNPRDCFIVTASADKTARVWDAQTWVQLHVLEVQTEGVWSAAYSPGGRTIVTTSADFSAKVWIARIEDLLDLSEHLV